MGTSASSLNNTEQMNAMLQYKLRQLWITGGYLKLPQGFSIIGRAADYRLVVLYWSFQVVQVLLRSILRGKPGQLLVCALALVLAPGAAAKSSKKDPQPVLAPELQLEGGRRLTYERSFWSEREVKLKRGFWNKLVDIVAGAPEFHSLINPYEVVTDSHGRIIVTDPGRGGNPHF